MEWPIVAGDIMTCTPVTLPGGGQAIVCGPRQARKPCSGCGGRADLLCDWKVPARKSGTCDAPICARCSHVPAPGKDLCPAHRDLWLARQSRQPERAS